MTQSPNPSALPQFSQLTIQGEDAEKFLQGQLTCDVTKLGLSYQAAAICNLKGRIEFGIWIKKQAEKHYDVVIIGGGGHGVATAYYLAKYQGITNVAILEKAY